MKNTGQCPKCGGREIAHSPGGKMDGQSNVNFGNAFCPTLIRISHYVCKNCGFAELWVDREGDLEDLRRQESVRPPDR